MDSSFDDNCCELKSLRAFRDTYVKTHHPEAIEEYYRVAPKIVAAIRQREDSQVIYQRIYSGLVLKTLRLIDRNQREDAYRLYRDYGLALKRYFC